MRSNIHSLTVKIYIILFFNASIFYSQTLTAEQIYKKINNTVVVVHAYNSNNELVKQGSGVVLNEKGYIVTNYHVLSGCDRIEILHNKEIVPYVDIIGIDVEKDILILKIKAKKFPAIKLGDSKDLNIGQRVYAIGSPLGFENTISEGIISGLRSYEEYDKNYIQITASISPGSSGGAVVNDKGELIGISTLTVEKGQNLNFAIPINDILNVDISSYGKDDTYKDFELLSKGNYAADNGNYYGAINYYSSFIEKFNTSAVGYFNRGFAYGKIKEYEREIKDYNIAIEIDPYFTAAYLNRGNAQFNQNNFSAAVSDYNKAIELNPNYALAYKNRGYLKGFLEDYWGAINDFNKAIENNPYDALTYMYRGISKRKLEDYRGAIQDCSKAIEISPADGEIYYERGLSKCLLEDKTGGCLDMSKAGELGYLKAYNFIRDVCN